MGLFDTRGKAKKATKATEPTITKATTDELMKELTRRHRGESFEIESYQEFQLKVDRQKACSGHGMAVVLVLRE